MVFLKSVILFLVMAGLQVKANENGYGGEVMSRGYFMIQAGLVNSEITNFPLVVRLDSRAPQFIAVSGFTPSPFSYAGDIFQHIHTGTGSFVSTSINPEYLGDGVKSVGMSHAQVLAAEGSLPDTKYYRVDYPNEPLPVVRRMYQYYILNAEGFAIPLSQEVYAGVGEVVHREILPKQVVAYRVVDFTERLQLNYENAFWIAEDVAVSQLKSVGPLQPMPGFAIENGKPIDVRLLNAVAAGEATTAEASLLGQYVARATGPLLSNLANTALIIATIVLEPSPAGDPLTNVDLKPFIAKANTAYSNYMQDNNNPVATYGDFLERFLCAPTCTSTLQTRIDQVRRQELAKREGWYLSMIDQNASSLLMTSFMIPAVNSYVRRIVRYYDLKADDAFEKAVNEALVPAYQQFAVDGGYTGPLSSPNAIRIGEDIMQWIIDSVLTAPISVKTSVANLDLVKAAETMAEFKVALNENRIAQDFVLGNMSEVSLGILRGENVQTLLDEAKTKQTESNSELNQMMLDMGNQGNGFYSNPAWNSITDSAENFGQGVLNQNVDAGSSIESYQGMMDLRNVLPSDQFIDTNTNSLGAVTEGTTTALTNAQTTAFLAAATKAKVPVSKTSGSNGNYAFVQLPFEMGGFVIRVPTTP